MGLRRATGYPPFGKKALTILDQTRRVADCLGLAMAD